jgi:hypothetical protein
MPFVVIRLRLILNTQTLLRMLRGCILRTTVIVHCFLVQANAGATLGPCYDGWGPTTPCVDDNSGWMDTSSGGLSRRLLEKIGCNDMSCNFQNAQWKCCKKCRNEQNHNYNCQQCAPLGLVSAGGEEQCSTACSACAASPRLWCAAGRARMTIRKQKRRRAKEHARCNWI